MTSRHPNHRKAEAQDLVVSAGFGHQLIVPLVGHVALRL